MSFFDGSSTCVKEASQISWFGESTSLSEEVLRLRLQALNLPITGSKAVLVHWLKAATHPRKSITSRPSKTQAVARANTSTRSTRQATSAHHEQPKPATVQAPEAVLSGEDSEEELVETYSDLDDPLVEDLEETTPNTGNSFTPAQLATIGSTVQSSVDRAPQSFSISANLNLWAPHLLTAAHSLGGQEQQRSLEDKILWGELIAFTLLLPDSLT